MGCTNQIFSTHVVHNSPPPNQNGHLQYSLFLNQSSNSLNMLFLNIQGLTYNKILALEGFLINLKVYILCLTEHWLSELEIKLMFPQNFHCASMYCRTNHIRGGASIFLHNDIDSRIFDVTNFLKNSILRHQLYL